MLVEQTAKGTRITAANRAAVMAGAAVGLALADARAACPLLRVEKADHQADAMMLERLAGWAMRYSPFAAIDGTDGLFLDIAGCDHLFGGEARLITDCRARLAKAGFTTQAGLAPTPGAARALASFSARTEIVHTAGLCERLDALPVEALRLDEDRLVLLTRLGLKRIGDLRAIPRPVLERRFRSREAARSVLLRLDQMMGDIREPLVPLAPPSACREYLPCAEPAIHTEAVTAALSTLLGRLKIRLDRQGKGARHFRLTAFHTDGTSSDVSIRLSQPGSDSGRIARLFGPKLDTIDCGFGIDGFLLAADGLEPVRAEQAVLAGADDRFSGETAEAPEVFANIIAPMIDTLANRLGGSGIYQLAAVERHVPERADRRVAAGTKSLWQQWKTAQPALPRRPQWLFDYPLPIEVLAGVPDGPPRQFVWRRVKRIIVRASSPERIAPEWWLSQNGELCERDYYVVEDEEGRQYWLYRQGHYGGTGEAAPRWYLHGLFL